MLGSGSFTHGEIVTVTVRGFCLATTPAVASILIARILIGFTDEKTLSTRAEKQPGNSGNK